MQPLHGRVAVVAGATRGAGRGIATMLGEAGATVYCTGRSTRANRTPRTTSAAAFDLTQRPETIEETAELVTAHGGTGIAVQVDHTDEAQVAALFARVAAEQGGLDILVNDIWGGDALTQWGAPFWEQSPATGWQLLERAVRTHIITSRYGIPLLIERRQGLVVEITDGDTLDYRGNFYYDLAKLAANRMAYALAEELRPYGITALAVTPGFLRSEAMLEHFGVTADNWQAGAERDPHFIASETAHYVGRAIAALAADPDIFRKTGQTFSSWGLAAEYGLRDSDGRQPNWGAYFAEHVAGKGV